MKPKEYISKYKMDVSEHFDHSMFVADLTVDLQSQIEYQKSVGQYALPHFENIVKQIKQKFDSISYKAKMPIEKWDKLWKFFYASVVVKVRDADFAEEIQKRRDEKRKRWEWENNLNFNPSTGGYGGYSNFREDVFARIFREFFFGGFKKEGFTTNSFSLHVGPPVKEFGELGLVPEKATVEDVNREFRKLALQYHPDKGGDAERFRIIMEAKNRCLMYLQSGVPV